MRAYGLLVVALVIPVSLYLYACTEEANDAPTRSTLLDGSSDGSSSPKDGSSSTVPDTGASTPDAMTTTDATTRREAGPDATTIEDAGVDAEADADAASTTIPVLCTQADFDATCAAPNGGSCLTSTQVDISFPATAAPAQYVNHCVKVKVGTDIDFAGDFTFHPLEPHGGDTPTPIPTQATNPAGGTGLPEVLVKMTTAGTYGFRCTLHTGTMWGAIQVVP